MNNIAYIVTDGGYGFTCEVETGDPLQVVRNDDVHYSIPRYPHEVWMTFMDLRVLDWDMDNTTYLAMVINSKQAAEEVINKIKRKMNNA